MDSHFPPMWHKPSLLVLLRRGYLVQELLSADKMMFLLGSAMGSTPILNMALSYLGTLVNQDSANILAYVNFAIVLCAIVLFIVFFGVKVGERKVQKALEEKRLREGDTQQLLGEIGGVSSGSGGTGGIELESKES